MSGAVEVSSGSAFFDPANGLKSGVSRGLRRSSWLFQTHRP